MDILKVKQNGVWTTIPAIIGPRGIGITSITKTGTSGLTDTYTITFSDNTTTTFTLNNGAVPNLTIGTVTEGATAAATITGTTDAPVLNLVLPNANVPTRVSELENDAGYLTEHQDISGKADKTDTVLETTLSRGRTANTTVGERSFAFGYNVEASGLGSHAEGATTIASGSYSHAEGALTEASGHYSHAENGSNIGSIKTLASGNYSHAEGRATTAAGAASHAEGGRTKANGENSHAEGFQTIANGEASHSGGKFNIADSYTSWPEWVSETEYAIGDKVKITTTADNKTIVKGYICKTANSDVEFTASKWTEDTYMNYARIIGNGTSSARSNAYALTWEGDGKYMGDVYVHANADSTGGSKVLTAADIAGKQDTLTFDTTPTTSSTNPVTSGGIKSYVDTAVSNINTMNIHICTAQEYNAETGVPTIQNPDTQTFYLVPGGEGSNLFIEWAYVNSAWERFGSADVDLSNYVQKTDYATASVAGVVKSNPDGGIAVSSETGKLRTDAAAVSHIKQGSNTYRPITPNNVYAAAFYGLAAAAGDSTQSASSNAVGTYTDAAKTAIQTMLDVPAKSDIPDTSIYATKADTVLETTLSKGRRAGSTVGVGSFAWGINASASGSFSYAVGNNVGASGALSHAEGYNTQANGTASFVFGKTNVQDSYTNWPEWTANTSYNIGDHVKKTDGTSIKTYICQESNQDSEFIASKWIARLSGQMNYAEIVGNGELNDPSNAYALDWDGNGHYMGDVYVHANADSSGGIKLATTTDIPDVQINGTSIVSNNVANIPIGSTSTTGNLGVVKSGAGVKITAEGNLYISAAQAEDIKAGDSGIYPIAPNRQHNAVFYGLAKAAGDSTQSSSANAVGTYTAAAQTAIKTMIGVQEGLEVVRLI